MRDNPILQQSLAQIMAAVQGLQRAGLAAEAAELQKTLVQAGAIAETLRKR